MDDRQDKLIDVVLGVTFNNLKPKTDVPAAGATIVEIKGCADFNSMKNLQNPQIIIQFNKFYSTT